jgi:hypothetical protein
MQILIRNKIHSREIIIKLQTSRKIKGVDINFLKQRG